MINKILKTETGDSPCSGHDRKKLFKEKKCLCPRIKGGNVILGDFLG